MAISAVAASYAGQGPTATGQILASGGSDEVELAYKGEATATLDGTATSFVVNFIDGTQTIPFTPSGILVSVCGGTQTTYVGASANSISSTGFTVNLSAAGTAANTVKVAFVVLK